MRTIPREPVVDVVERDDGTLVLTCPIAPLDVPDDMVTMLVDRAARHPDRLLLSEQDEAGVWHDLTYGDAVDRARRVAQWLLDHDGGPDRTLAVLSARSLDHFVLSWGAQMARVPVCPVSVPYSTVPGAFGKLSTVLDLVAPAFVYAADPALHRAGLEAVANDSAVSWRLDDATLITDAGGHDGAVALHELLTTEPTDDVDASIGAITPDTVTKYIFTSGSTGVPKGVIQTHRMHRGFLGAMCALADERDDGDVRVLDWMPWSHVAAGVMRQNMLIHDGGTIHLDRGRPLPGQYDATIENLAAIRPTVASGSPIGWGMLVDALEADDELAASFFGSCRSFGFGAAAMPTSVADRLQALARAHTGGPILLTTSLLSTEVSVGLNRWWPTEDHDVLGLPGPGSEVKLLPLGDGRYELRPRGPGITPGYLGDPAITEAAFDEEGFFLMGDAVRFRDPDDRQRGLCFAGRVAEDFKLVSGTWVQSGALRSRVVAAASPLVRDAVICGLNEAEVTALLWPNPAACADLAGDADPARSPAVRAAIAEGLAAHNRANPASSTAIRRFLLLDSPPDPTRNEITEKGYVNQRAAQLHRADELARLYAPDRDADDDVVTVPE